MIKRIFIEPHNRYKESLYSDINDLIHYNGNGHITQQSADYFNRPSSLGLGVCYFVKARNKHILVGFSGCKSEPKVDFSITVVSPEFRGLGIGNDLLKEKVALLPEFHTIVAEDNAASVRACEKAGLYMVGTSTGKRKNGEFKQLHFSKLKVEAKEIIDPMILKEVTADSAIEDGFMVDLFKELDLAAHPGG